MSDALPLPDVPEGWGPLPRSSPFLERIGPLYCKGAAPELSLGFRVQPWHLNNRDRLHGGVLPAIADVMMGYAMALAADPPRRLTTASLRIDYLGTAEAGDWVEARMQFRHEGSRLSFGGCLFYCGERVIARAETVFANG
ncbi:MAG TPA: PaaI family thioesterase [Burkholderiaceae bacterium]|jgi:acyl-coenzyme A thioesterase 13|nr:PaaI family thioesterase [Burkholderiaceae bacterium]